jgi:hypothetical protein
MTAQVHEGLVLDGQKLSLACEPRIPEHPRIKKVSEEEANASNPWVFSTACWRNYVGNWKIDDGRLYLVGIIGIYKLVGEEPLFAQWYSGTLRVPIGDMTEYVHMGYASKFDRELFIEVKNGLVVQRDIKTFSACSNSSLKNTLKRWLAACGLSK